MAASIMRDALWILKILEQLRLELQPRDSVDTMKSHQVVAQNGRQ
jgi:hypothetical protein